MACIILVEDNTLIREAVSGYLQLDNHQTIEFGTTDGVMETIERNVADLAILDVMLPDGNGFSLAKSIRNVSDIPLIFLTAKDSESDRILGFELGADDYICKPTALPFWIPPGICWKLTGRRFPSPVQNGRFLCTLPQTVGR